MIPLDTYSPSYWLLADDQLDLGLDRAKADLFRAHFNHSLLFNPSLLFSDSMAINNRNFRHLVEHDSEFRTLIENSHFGIAVRTDANNRALDLIELKERFIKDRKSRVTELDHSDAGLQFLQNCSEIVPYSGQELAQFYSEQVVDLFLHDAIQKKLSGDIANDVHYLASQARSELGAGFGRDFFVFRLRDRLIKHRRGKSRSAEADVDASMQTIHRISEYHYITALPSKIDTTPIYANKHADAFDICRGRSDLHSVDGYNSDHHIRLLTGLASFEKYVARLPAEDILELRKTDEASEYFTAKYNFDAKTYDESKRNFMAALAAYVRRIEDRIIHRFDASRDAEDTVLVKFDVRRRLQSGLMTGIDYSPDALVYISIAAELSKHSVPAALGLLFVMPALAVARKTVRASLGNTYVSPNASEEQSDNDLRNLKVHELTVRGTLGGQRIEAEAIVKKTSEEYVPDETLYSGL
jgi:hypothetical protein